ncbi:MAG: TonB-dependent receptor [Kordiimonadaceae bacterium]|nr:TonB-dependent receptor [Kordiimonadaceae bacterium]
MKKSFILGGVSLTALIQSFPLYAAPAEDVIVTSATRYDKPVSNIGSSISVVSAENIEIAQTVFLKDILTKIPGVTATQNGSFGGVSSLRIRGTTEVVVLMDGIQINDGASPDGRANFANYDVNAIERIEVLRGPQSLLYGSDAMGGVVNIITNSGSDGLGGGAFVEGGSYTTINGGANIHGGDEKLHFNFAARGITTDGISKADENNGNTEADGYHNISLNSKVGSRLTDNFSTEFIGHYSKSRNEFDDYLPPFYTLQDADKVDHTTEYLLASRSHLDLLDGNFRNTFSFQYSNTLREDETGNNLSPQSKSNRINIDYFGHYKIDDAFGVSFGLQHEEVEAEANNTDAQKFNMDSVLSEIDWQGITGLTLTAGVRYDDHSQAGDTFTPRITAAYYIEESGTKIFSNWAEGFKAPTITQLTHPFNGNLDLKPERSKGWEIGIEQSIMEGQVLIGATYFHQNFKDKINYVLIDPNFFIYQYQNVDKVISKGIELSLNAELNDTISLYSSYTYTDSKDIGLGTQLLLVPKNTAFAEIIWSPLAPLKLGLSATYTSRTEDFAASLDSWTRFDFRASYQLNEMLEIYGRIDNLFNKEYQQVFEYGTPDRSGYIGARIKF